LTVDVKAGFLESGRGYRSQRSPAIGDLGQRKTRRLGFKNVRAADPGDELFPAFNSLLLPQHFEFARNLPAGVFDTPIIPPQPDIS
jgi:hypothetical protein